ncbi:hypothetical protein [Mycolicibacterium sp.]|uniref:hypothetical protein n=1 Tax=Mycolicibacterium sp. TaxID=2320850 RepID=UPI003D13B107
MRTTIGIGVVLAAVAGCGTAATTPAALSDSFAGPDGLIAAEHQPATDGSPWTVTSGSLFRSGGAGWTGVPDAGGAPGSTGSAVFRMVSTDRSFGDVDMTLTLEVVRLVSTPRTPARDYDGAHLWVRYRSPEELYAVSVDRRDGRMIIKKKCPGGPSNGGTYHDLSPYVPGAPIPFGRRQQVMVAVRDLPDGSVAVNATRDGIAVSAVDTGVGCPPLTGGGGVGLRGDNSELRFTDLIVEPLR